MLNAAPTPALIWHPTLGQVRYQVTELSNDPDQQVAQTISLMQAYAREDASNPTLQADVAQAWRSDDAIGDTFNYLRRNGTRGMRFVNDEVIGSPWDQMQQPAKWSPVVETLIRPADQAIMPNPQGDCDDFAMYGASHLTARGVPVSFVTVAADANEPDVYSHVYLAAYPKDGPYGGQRVPVDLSHGPYPGWEVPNRFGKLCEWPVDGGIGMAGWGLLLGGSYLLYRALKRRAN